MTRKLISIGEADYIARQPAVHMIEELKDARATLSATGRDDDASRLRSFIAKPPMTIKLGWGKKRR
jgi:hypothetical protein